MHGSVTRAYKRVQNNTSSVCSKYGFRRLIQVPTDKPKQAQLLEGLVAPRFSPRLWYAL